MKDTIMLPTTIGFFIFPFDRYRVYIFKYTFVDDLVHA